MADTPRGRSLPPGNDSDDFPSLVNPGFSPPGSSVRFSKSADESVLMETASTKPAKTLSMIERIKREKVKNVILFATIVLLVLIGALTIIYVVDHSSNCETQIRVDDEAVDGLEALLDIATLIAPGDMTEKALDTKNLTTISTSTTDTTSTTTSTTEPTTTSTEPPSTTISPREQMRDTYRNFTERFNRTFSENGLDNYIANSAFFSKGISKFEETQFADLSVDQLRKLLSPQQDPQREATSKRCDIHAYHGDDSQKQNGNIVGSNLYGSSDRIPSRVDLRRRGIIGAVRNQGTSCNAGYAFSVASLLESKVETNGSRLSVQMLLADEHNHHCEGGETFRAMESVELDGLVIEALLPYDETQEWHEVDGNVSRYRYANACLLTGSHRNGERYWDYGKNQYRLKEEDVVSASTYITHFLSKIGTVVVEVPVDHAFFFYKSGPYSPDCNTILGFQPVVVVGYGMSSGEKVWIIRNSFGTDWGIDGDFEMARDANCGAFDYAFTFYNAV